MKNEPFIRILLVFPEQTEASGIEEALSASGSAFSTRLVPSVQDALSSLAAQPFDFIFAAKVLPDGSAVDIIRRYPIVPCVVYFSGSDPLGMEEALASGALDCFVPSEDRLAQLGAYVSRLWRIRRRLSLENGFISKRYEDLVEALPDIVYELDPQGRFSFVNQSIRMLGYTPEELLGQHFSVLLFEEDLPHVSRDSVLPLYDQNVTGDRNAPKLFDERRGVDRKTENLELRLRRKSVSRLQDPDLIASVISYGEIASAGAYRSLGEPEDKVFVGTVGIIRDITLRRKAEDMLRKMYQAVDQSPMAVAILNKDLKVEYVNPAFFGTTGTGPSEVIGRRIGEMLGEAGNTDVWEDLIASVRSGIDWKGEIQCPRMRGDAFWASILLSAIRSPSGAITHFLCQIEDISRKHSLDELLKQAKIAAEDASRAKSDFLANMSHELRTPLSGILALCDMLAADLPRPGQSEKISSIKSSASNLLYLLNDLLDLSKIEARAVELHNGDFDLKRFADTTLAPFKAQALQKGLAFEVGIEDGGFPRLNSDAGRLGQIVSNLVSNAVKFSEKGLVEVRFTVRLKEGMPALFVSIRDTGPGISGVDQQKLFKPFSQIGVSLSKQYGGTGLGLAISKELAMRLGGDVAVESSPGQGSTFSFFVPIQAASTEPAVLPDLGDLKASIPYHLLVAEDNPVNRDYLRFFLEKAGHRVELANDGYEALTALEKGDFDAILMDIQMPGLDGIAATNTIRAYSGSNFDPLTPVIALTAFESGDLGEEYQKAGFDGFCGKPVNIHSLLAQIESIVKGKERFDLERVRRLYAASADDFRRLLLIAAQDLPKRIGSFEAAWAEGNTPDIRTSLHSAVSVLSAISAIHALQLIRRLRKHWQGGEQEAANAAAKDLVSECAAIVSQVERALAR